MDEARREASTRVEAIVTDGRESCEKRTILDRREGLGELLKTARRTVGLVWMREKMKTEGKRTERRSGERVGHGPTQGKLAASLPASNDLPKFRLRLGYHGPIGSQSGNTRTHYIMAVVGPLTQPKASKEGKMTPREPERHYLCSGDIGSSYTNETLKELDPTIPGTVIVSTWLSATEPLNRCHSPQRSTHILWQTTHDS